MDKPPVTLKVLLLFALIAFLFVAVSLVNSHLETSTKVVFCDVGQGDAAYLRIHNKIDVLVDTGGDRKILNCLGKYMPFYDRRIEIIFVTHPHKDHYGGLSFLSKYYSVSRLITVPNRALGLPFQNLLTDLKQKGTLVQNLYAGDSVNFGNSSIRFIWPEVEYISNNLDRQIDPNSLSQVFIFSQKGFDILFTGDYENADYVASKLDVDIEILKVPHHGSKEGINERFLAISKPEIAVISVGQKNRYGHPAKSIIDLLQSSKIKILRTDEKGPITFKIN